MNLILGYVGNAYSGKDTTSNIITEQFFGALQISGKRQGLRDTETNVAGNFATMGSKDKIIVWHTPLALEVKREYVAENPGVILDKLLYDPAYKSQHREGLIAVGDGRRENVDPLYWIKKVQATIQYLLQKYADYKHHIFNITDMRYENELPAFEDYCYRANTPILSFKLNTSFSTILKRMPQSDIAEYARKHKNNPSERHVKRVHADIELDNNGTLEELKQQISKEALPALRTILFGYIG